MIGNYDIPAWAIDRALERCGIDPGQTRFLDWRDRTYARAVELLAHMIAEHEEAPVDPLLIEAKRAVEEMVGHEVAWTDQRVSFGLACLHRGIELGKSGSHE